ncbi:maleylpyruvate isomerase family mycothiol-dependent enzyme [Gordonia sp. NPDC062954]|uniref:maleylpyruvate isomerase family mycothiol-dependent enzyme n=1 Tax=Gordonia sp. NPDC062954 TaxID=3364003 RepID=UPI0037CA74CC
MNTSESVRPATEIKRIQHTEAMRLTAAENARLLDLLQLIDPDDWGRPTDCTGWTVRDVVVHLIASAQAQANPVEFLRQVRSGRPLTAEIGGDHWVDGLNEAQLRARTQWRTDDLPALWEQHSAAALRARTRMPAPVRALPVLPIGTPLGVDLGWKPLGYLFGIGFTRDTWMHRVDLSRATGIALQPTADHDGRIVEDILAEWSQLHDQPFSLDLQGPAGGRFEGRSGAATISVDAIEYARILSGRADGDGVLANKLPL